jgi:hypothetical protein
MQSEKFRRIPSLNKILTIGNEAATPFRSQKSNIKKSPIAKNSAFKSLDKRLPRDTDETYDDFTQSVLIRNSRKSIRGKHTNSVLNAIGLEIPEFNSVKILDRSKYGGNVENCRSDFFLKNNFRKKIYRETVANGDISSLAKGYDRISQNLSENLNVQDKIYKQLYYKNKQLKQHLSAKQETTVSVNEKIQESFNYNPIGGRNAIHSEHAEKMASEIVYRQSIDSARPRYINPLQKDATNKTYAYCYKNFDKVYPPKKN